MRDGVVLEGIVTYDEHVVETYRIRESTEWYASVVGSVLDVVVNPEDGTVMR